MNRGGSGLWRFSVTVAAGLVLLAHGCERKMELPKGYALSEKEREVFLAERTGFTLGLFPIFSFVAAFGNGVVYAEGVELDETKLQHVFPRFYKPTWAEFFDCIARQTKSSWSYDAKRYYWLFARPQQPLPFACDLAEGWTREDRGLYVFHRPPSARVGMDIYMLGRYSFEEGEEEGFKKVRNALAVRFASKFQKDITPEKMETVEVDGAEALYFESPAPREGRTWRQWVFVKGGHAFAIVSLLKEEQERELLPDVRRMVSSFRVIPRKPRSTARQTPHRLRPHSIVVRAARA